MERACRSDVSTGPWAPSDSTQGAAARRGPIASISRALSEASKASIAWVGSPCTVQPVAWTAIPSLGGYRHVVGRSAMAGQSLGHDALVMAVLVGVSACASAVSMKVESDPDVSRLDHRAADGTEMRRHLGVEFVGRWWRRPLYFCSNRTRLSEGHELERWEETVLGPPFSLWRQTRCVRTSCVIMGADVADRR
jgi:hypothetical protein